VTADKVADELGPAAAPPRCLEFEPPPAGWAPPTPAGRAILRVMLAVKARRESLRRDAALTGDIIAMGGIAYRGPTVRRVAVEVRR
jgi:hypothetical protein